MIDPRAIQVAMKIDGARPADDHLVFPDGREVWLKVDGEAWSLSDTPGVKISASSAMNVMRMTADGCCLRRGPVELHLALVQEKGDGWAEVVQVGRDRSPCAKAVDPEPEVKTKKSRQPKGQ